LKPIYTTPTEIYGGIGFNSLEDKSRKVSAIPAPPPAPIYLQKGYLMRDRGFTWNPPNIDAGYVVGYAVQQNTTGQYVDIQSFGTNSPIFIGQAGGYYRIKILFSSFGLDYESYSDTLIYPSAFTPPTVLIDDNQRGVSFNYLSDEIFDLPLAVQRLEPIDVDRGISFSYLSNGITDLPLATQRIEPPTDSFGNGISFAFLNNSIVDIPLGGVIIG
jgi:hypothetical protein